MSPVPLVPGAVNGYHSSDKQHASKPGVEHASGAAMGWRKWAKAGAAATLLVALVLAASSYVLSSVSNTVESGVLKECYGRYEVCIEEQYKDNLPVPGVDKFLLSRTEVLSDGDVVDAVYKQWVYDCRDVEQPEQSLSDVPKYCTCTQKLYDCGELGEIKTEASVLGAKYRRDTLARAVNLMIVSYDLWTSFIMIGSVSTVLFLVAVLTVPWAMIQSMLKARNSQAPEEYEPVV